MTDKVRQQIMTILDACLRKDKSSRVACEVMATKGKIIVAGEITCDGKVDIRWEVREVLRKVGYNPWKFTVFVFVHKQSKDIDAGVTTALEARNGSEERYASLGAGDQGTVYGYAANETREMLPLPLVLAHRIRVTTKRIPQMKHYGDISKLNGANLPPVDIITFGSPCTDMSVAGKRAGLDGEQSVLFYEAIRIIKEMRCNALLAKLKSAGLMAADEE